MAVWLSVEIKIVTYLPCKISSGPPLVGRSLQTPHYTYDVTLLHLTKVNHEHPHTPTTKWQRHRQNTSLRRLLRCADV